MSLVIHGATGAQGAPLFASLLSAGKPALAAVRDPAKADGRPYVLIDNDSVDTLVTAYTKADGVFFHLPQTAEPIRLQYARNVVEAIKRAKPRRVVLSTSGAVVDEPGSPLQVPDDSAVATLVRGVQESGVSHAVIAPRLYLENLLLPMVMGAVKEKGVLPYPVRADLPVSWSSHLDIAELAERLLTDNGVTGVVGVGHLPGLKGIDLASAFSAHLGRPVEFLSQSPDDFQSSLEPLLGPAAANVAAFYRALAQVRDNVIVEETSAQRLVGLEPLSVEKWLAEVLGEQS